MGKIIFLLHRAFDCSLFFTGFVGSLLLLQDGRCPSAISQGELLWVPPSASPSDSWSPSVRGGLLGAVLVDTPGNLLPHETRE